jgi:heme/copper-type cytochrome/quinol oxidase subunit 2
MSFLSLYYLCGTSCIQISYIINLMPNQKDEDKMNTIFEFLGACVVAMLGVMVAIILIMCVLSYISSLVYRRSNKPRGNKLRNLT